MTWATKKLEKEFDLNQCCVLADLIKKLAEASNSLSSIDI